MESHQNLTAPVTYFVGAVNSIRLKQRETIPAKTIKRVQIKTPLQTRLEKGKDYIFTPKRSASGVHVASSLVHYDGVNPMFTNIINPTDIPRPLIQGTVVGTLAPVQGQIVKITRTGKEKVMTWTKHGSLKTYEEQLKKAFEKTVLSTDQVSQLKALLEKYKDRFAPNPLAPGTTDKVVHEINTGDASPVKAHPARASPAEQEYIKDAIGNMIKGGIIRPSRSPWASRIVLAKKKDGSPRFCIDYRKLNELTVKDSYPIPYQQDLMDNLSRAKYFSSMDMASGFWQIPLSKDAIPKTAFTSRFGLYEYLVMPFGLTNAPSSFQRLMDLVLAGLNWVECMVYIDDIIIYSETWEEHLERVEHVLQRLREFNVVAKLDKCQFGRSNLPYLGHIVTPEGIKTDPDKVKTVQEIKNPTTVTEVRAFLGVCSYYRKFIKDFADIAEPLLQLLKKRAKFVWTDECSNAVTIFKQSLMQAPLLQRPDFTNLLHLLVTQVKSEWVRF